MQAGFRRRPLERQCNRCGEALPGTTNAALPSQMSRAQTLALLWAFPICALCSPGVGLVNRLFWRLYTDGRFADGRAMSVNLLVRPCVSYMCSFSVRDLRAWLACSTIFNHPTIQSQLAVPMQRRGKEGPGEPSYRAAIAAYAPGVSSLKLQCYNDDYNSEEEDFPFHEVLGPLAPRVRRLQLHSMAGMPGLFPFLSGWPALEDVEVSEWGDFFDRYQSYWEGWPRGLAAKVRRLDTDLPGVAVVLPRLTALTRLSLKKGVDLPPVQLACLLPPLRQLRYFAFQELGCTSSDCDTLAATLSLLPHLEHCHLGSVLCREGGCLQSMPAPACGPLLPKGPCAFVSSATPSTLPTLSTPLLAAACLVMPMPSAQQSPSCRGSWNTSACAQICASGP
jgi:hypothetical protein